MNTLLRKYRLILCMSFILAGTQSSYASTFLEYLEEFSQLTENIGPNHYKGKVLSVISDSIGLWPCKRGEQELTQEEMYWGIIMKYFSMQKGEMSTFGGSAVANSGSRKDPFLYRIKQMDLSKTDYLLIEGGMNDLGWQCIPLGKFDYKTPLSMQVDTEFIPAYRKMLEYVQKNFKHVQIICCTIPIRAIKQNAFPWTNEKTGNNWIEYNEAIRKLAADYGVTLVDFACCGINFYNADIYTVDGVHPLREGQRLLGIQAVKDMQ